MKAVGYNKKGDVTTLVAFDTQVPKPGPKDLLVRVKGTSVNPVDYKVREWFDPDPSPRILGWDAAGIVEQVGEEVTKYKVGDEVFYAGEFTKAGTNAELQTVDERIVGKKPTTLSFSDAAALPLTAITAWELLFDSCKIPQDKEATKKDAILILGAAGGVGSIMIQLAKALTGLTVIATASRPETVEWVKKMGADHVISHRESLGDQLKQLGIAPRYVAGLNGTEGHLESIIEAIKTRGHIAIIDDPSSLDFTKYQNFKLKALTFSWEFMFARPLFQTDDMEAQYNLLNRVAELVDEGKLVSTVTETLGPMTVDVVKAAHTKQESGKVIGKIVMQGFEA